jgi:NADH-quinone oxidoreductase subunit C
LSSNDPTPESETADDAAPTDVAAADDAEEVAATEPDPLREELLDTLSSVFGDAILESHLKPGLDLWVRVTNDSWLDTATTLNDELDFKFFDFISVIDWLPSPYGRDMAAEQDWMVEGKPDKESEDLTRGYAGGDTRFQVLARVARLDNYVGVTLKVDLPDDNPSIASWTPVYPGAAWHEREAWEMFGVHFAGNPDLRHIYLPSEFEGHPMRKDFPLLARRVKPWPGIVDVEAMPGEDDG